MSVFVPVRANFTIYQGADWSRCIYLRDASNPELPLVFDYTRARLQLKEDYGLPALVTLSTTDGGIILTPADGKIEMILTDIQTALLPVVDEPLPFLYDLFCYDDEVDPQVDKVAWGFMIVWPQVTTGVFA